MFKFSSEGLLREYLKRNFKEYFGCEFIGQEVEIKGGRIDLIGQDEKTIYIIEIKRDIVDKDAVCQLKKYLNTYKGNKKLVGIIAAPKILEEAYEIINANENIHPKKLEGVEFVKPNIRVKRERLGFTINSQLLKEIINYQKQNKISSFSKAIRELLKEGLITKTTICNVPRRRHKM